LDCIKGELVLAKLSKAEKVFLNKHKISLGAVFDATGLGPKDYGVSMRVLGKSVAFGVTPCKKKGHTLRSRSGSCVVCAPASISFQSRFDTLAYVYIAGSLELNLIKAGYSSEIEARSYSLNEQNYAGASDWEILYWVKTENAGRIEFTLHSELSMYRCPTSFVRSGKTIDCLETFSCGASTVINVLKSLTEDINQTWMYKKNISSYEFDKLNNNGIKRKSTNQRNAGAIPIVRSKQKSFTKDVPSNHLNMKNSSDRVIPNQNTSKNNSFNNPKLNYNSWKNLLIKSLAFTVVGFVIIIALLLSLYE
jgi:hypothetical protein